MNVHLLTAGKRALPRRPVCALRVPGSADLCRLLRCLYSLCGESLCLPYGTRQKVMSCVAGAMVELEVSSADTMSCLPSGDQASAGWYT